MLSYPFRFGLLSDRVSLELKDEHALQLKNTTRKVCIHCRSLELEAYTHFDWWIILCVTQINQSIQLGDTPLTPSQTRITQSYQFLMRHSEPWVWTMIRWARKHSPPWVPHLGFNMPNNLNKTKKAQYFKIINKRTDELQVNFLVSDCDSQSLFVRCN